MPLLTLGVIFSLLTLLKFRRQETISKFLHSAFSRYVSRAVVDQLVQSPSSLCLEGEDKEVTVLFSDIRGFTTLSERLDPEEVSDLLRAYLTPMTATIIEHQGTLDKYMGDAIMAFWNAPLPVPGHQAQTLRAAVKMQAVLTTLNPRLNGEFGLKLAMGVGLHCGTVRVGNMGSEDLFDYTIIGDCVNLASRLEGLTKYYGLGILLSQDVKEACGAEFLFQEVDLVRVKGKKRPVSIFTVWPSASRQVLSQELSLYARARAAYQKQDFTRAGELFQSISSQHRDLELYQVYARRCELLAADPPGPDWDRVFEHQHK